MPVLAVLLAALCFGTTGTAQALAEVSASPLAVGAARVLVGGGLLALLAGRAAPLRRRPARPLTRHAVLAAVGAAGVLAYQPCFFLGTRLNGVAVGTVVALGSAPVVTGALDAVLRRRPPGRRWLLATALCVLGVVLVSNLLQGSTRAIAPGGLLASVGAGASYAVYTLASKALLDRGWSPVATTGGVFGVAAAVSAPLLLVGGAAWVLTPRGGALALWLGVVTTAVAYVLFARGLQRLRAATVSTLTLAEPLAATMLGALLLGERLTPLAVGGVAAILAGLVVLSARRPAHGVPVP